MLNYNKEYWKDIQDVTESVKGLEGLFGKDILITGATGMICSTVVDLLWYLNEYRSADIRLTLAGRNKEKMNARFPYMKDGDFEFMFFDTSDIEGSDKRYDFIIHGAGNADPKAIMKEPVETILTNIYGLRRLFSFLNEKDSRMLFISSSEIYGRNPGNDPLREGDYGFVDILNPRACYPGAKRVSETLCAAFMEEYGKDSVIVRPGHVYGPSVSDRDSRASAEFTRKAAEGKDIVLKSDGKKIRSYIYTLDCASAIITVLLHGESVNAYNISLPDTNVTIRDFAETMAVLSGVKVIIEAETSVERKKGNLMDNSSIDPNKLMSLGWKPVFDLDRGIKATLRDYKKE